MQPDHDIAPFDAGAERFHSGRRPRWQRALVTRSVDIAVATVPVPLRVLDVGSGTGALIRELSERLPNVVDLVGVDPAAGMIAVARRETDGLGRFVEARAESLPFDTGYFDLVVSTASFHHWTKQRAGLAEVARVLQPDGVFVLVDLSARWIRRRKGRRGVRSPRQIARLLAGADLRLERRETVVRSKLGLPFVRAYIVSR